MTEDTGPETDTLYVPGKLKTKATNWMRKTILKDKRDVFALHQYNQPFESLTAVVVPRSVYGRPSTDAARVPMTPAFRTKNPFLSMS